MTIDKRDAARDTSSVRRLILGYQVSRALLAADELAISDLLNDGAKTAQELARETGTHTQSLYRFLRALTTVDLVQEDKDGRFSLGPLASELEVAARIGIENYRAWVELPYSLRTGKSAFEKVYGKDFYTYLADDPDRMERFDSSLAALSRGWMPAVFDVYDFPEEGTVVDIGGGRGTFMSYLLRAKPNLHGILFDQPHVVEQAIPMLKQASVMERSRVVSGDFFESVPSGANIYTFCNVLIDWDDKQGAILLESCRKAMDEDGRVLIVDRVLPSTEGSNRQAMAFLDLFFLVLEGSRIRTREEFENLLESAGFKMTRFLETTSTFSVIEGCKT